MQHELQDKHMYILLTLEGFVVHSSFSVFMMLCDNNIIVMTLLPQSSERAQPIDHTFIGPFEATN